MRPIWNDWIVNTHYNPYLFAIAIAVLFIISAVLLDQIIRVPAQKFITGPVDALTNSIAIYCKKHFRIFK